MSDAAVRFGRAIGYTSAGTAEFMLDGRDFFFLELNGRIQVEHPVTSWSPASTSSRSSCASRPEAMSRVLDRTGQSVEVRQSVEDPEPVTTSGLARAAGHASDSAVPVLDTGHGHAVEVRLYAEDPRTFLPQGGRITRLVLPDSIRVDAGIAEGDEVPLAYDPLLAKLIAHGPTRDDAFDRLEAALAETVVEGVTTNLPFLRWLVAHPDVRDGRTTTAFLVEHPPLSAPPVRRPAAEWRGAWRLNLPAPPPAAPPDVDAAAHEQAAAHGESNVTAPMPGTVIKVLVAPGDHVRRASRSCSSRR